MIRFNKPFFSEKGLDYIREAILSGEISGNKKYTKKCHDLLGDRYGFKHMLLTTSCTSALEMAALLIDIKPGDEVIMPSYTFVSTANAFVLRGAKIVFVDSEEKTPNIDVEKIEPVITRKTKAIVPVHYAGVACDMDKIMALAAKYDLFVVEDAAQAIDSYYKNKPLGSIGHFGAFSFHDSKNITAGEGGLLSVNDRQFVKRSEIIWEKGTNRMDYCRGVTNKYTWVDIGSSFLMSDLNAAYLYSQLKAINLIQKRRKVLWHRYYEQLSSLAGKGYFTLPFIPSYATNNAHIFYLVCRSHGERDGLIQFLKSHGVLAVFHYLPLHNSPYYCKKHGKRKLPVSVAYSERLIRLPLYNDLKNGEQQKIIKLIKKFFQ